MSYLGLEEKVEEVMAIIRASNETAKRKREKKREGYQLVNGNKYI